MVHIKLIVYKRSWVKIINVELPFHAAQPWNKSKGNLIITDVLYIYNLVGCRNYMEKLSQGNIVEIRSIGIKKEKI